MSLTLTQSNVFCFFMVPTWRRTATVSPKTTVSNSDVVVFWLGWCEGSISLIGTSNKCVYFFDQPYYINDKILRRVVDKAFRVPLPARDPASVTHARTLRDHYTTSNESQPDYVTKWRPGIALIYRSTVNPKRK